MLNFWCQYLPKPREKGVNLCYAAEQGAGCGRDTYLERRDRPIMWGRATRSGNRQMDRRACVVCRQLQQGMMGYVWGQCGEDLLPSNAWQWPLSSVFFPCTPVCTMCVVSEFSLPDIVYDMRMFEGFLWARYKIEVIFKFPLGMWTDI